MLNTFNFLVDFFIHPRLKLEKSIYEKSKIAVLAFLIVLGMALSYGTFYMSQGYFWNVKAFHNYLGLSSAISGLFIIKKTGNTNFALTLVAFIGLYLVTASVYLSGGIDSNDILWYTVLSTASFMFVSDKTGIAISIASFIGTTSFYLLDKYSLVQLDSDPVSLGLDYRYFNFVLILGVLIFMVYVLVLGNRKLQIAIQLNKEQKVREEIARDFHDQIGNKLATLRQLSELIKMDKTKQEKELILSKIDSNAKDVYDNFRDFIWTLDAKSDQLTELFMYLRDFADDYLKFSTTNLFINSSPDPLPEFILPGYYSKEIVPIFKEAITNASKHANANNIYLNFTATKSDLIIKLKDDGNGFDKSIPNKGNGLRNMKKRAKKTGGDLTIITSEEKGTEIIYHVLLPHKGSAFIE